MTKNRSSINVLVTRPSTQAGPFCDLLCDAGLTPIRFPTLEIESVELSDEFCTLIESLPDFDIAIFISANAVEFSVGQGGFSLPSELTVVAIGPSSAAALGRYGIATDLVPESDFSSDGLLALPQFCQLAEKNVVIFRGVGGKKQLGDSLVERGATVRYAECYRRIIPSSVDSNMLRRALLHDEVDVVTVTSRVCLENLVILVGDHETARNKLLGLPLLLLSPQIESASNRLGFKTAPIIAPECTDAGMMAALMHWAA